MKTCPVHDIEMSHDAGTLFWECPFGCRLRGLADKDSELYNYHSHRADVAGEENAHEVLDSVPDDRSS